VVEPFAGGRVIPEVFEKGCAFGGSGSFGVIFEIFVTGGASFTRTDTRFSFIAV
jgi:hypothetical protein